MRLALAALSVRVAPYLLDREPQMRDQRFRARRLCARPRQLGIAGENKTLQGGPSWRVMQASRNWRTAHAPTTLPVSGFGRTSVVLNTDILAAWVRVGAHV